MLLLLLLSTLPVIYTCSTSLTHLQDVVQHIQSIMVHFK
jgi:hypothetical protein